MQCSHAFDPIVRPSSAANGPILWSPLTPPGRSRIPVNLSSILGEKATSHRYSLFLLSAPLKIGLLGCVLSSIVSNMIVAGLSGYRMPTACISIDGTNAYFNDELCNVSIFISYSERY
jgi:hypothetical protein